VVEDMRRQGIQVAEYRVQRGQEREHQFRDVKTKNTEGRVQS